MYCKYCGRKQQGDASFLSNVSRKNGWSELIVERAARSTGIDVYTGPTTHGHSPNKWIGIWTRDERDHTPFWKKANDLILMYTDYKEYNRQRIAEIEQKLATEQARKSLLCSDFMTGDIFHCPTCNAGQSEPKHGKKTACLCCGQEMIVHGNALCLIGERKHYWDTPENKVDFGRYSIELEYWMSEWHAIVKGPAVKTNKNVAELAFFSCKSKAEVSKLALAFLHEHV